MKKTIIAIIAMMMFLPMIADAQITIGKKETAPKKIATIAMAWYDLYEYNGTYSISLRSTNQYDDSYWLHLGNKATAIVSLKSLIDLCDTITKDDILEIDNGAGKTYIVQKYQKGLSFQQKEPGMAGHTYMHKMYFTKALNIIEQQ
jgi:hypothetical protein